MLQQLWNMPHTLYHTASIFIGGCWWFQLVMDQNGSKLINMTHFCGRSRKLPSGKPAIFGVKKTEKSHAPSPILEMIRAAFLRPRAKECGQSEAASLDGSLIMLITCMASLGLFRTIRSFTVSIWLVTGWVVYHRLIVTNHYGISHCVTISE